MATIQDINAGSNYIGESALGGGFTPFVELNTRPLDQLAAYTMLSNQVKWKQKQYETDLKVRELADLSKISLNDLRGKDKEQATKEFTNLIKYASEYARKQPKNEQERLQNELEWQTRYGAFKNNFGSGKTRAVTYAKRYSDIMGGTQDAKAKNVELEILDKEFEDTGIDTPISAIANFKTEVADIPKPTPQEFNSVIIGDNENIAVNGKIYNPKNNAGIADAAILGIKRLYPKEGTKEYSLLSELEKNEAKVQSTVSSKGKLLIDATEPLNEVLMKYVDPTTKVFDATSFENDNASYATIMEPYNGLKRYNDYNRQKYEQAKGRMFDSKGLKVELPTNIVADDFKVGFVDFAKGVNANQLVQSGMFAQYTGDTFTPKVTETDNAIQRQQLGLRYAELDFETEKFNKANTQDKLAANGVLREITDIINIGDRPENQVDVVDSNTGKTKRVFKIGDPTILQKFGNIDKEGNVTNVPDEARYNPKTNEIDLVYFQRDADDNTKIKRTSSGGSYIRDSKPLNARTWANMIVQRSGSGKERGEINEIIQSVITKNGGDLYKIAKALDPNTATTTPTKTEPTDLSSLDPNGFKKEGKNYRYKDGTLYDAKGNIVNKK